MMKKVNGRKQTSKEVESDKVLHSYKGAASYLGLSNPTTLYFRHTKLGTMVEPDYYLDGKTPLWKESTLDAYKLTYRDGRTGRSKHDGRDEESSDPGEAEKPET